MGYISALRRIVYPIIIAALFAILSVSVSSAKIDSDNATACMDENPCGIVTQLPLDATRTEALDVLTNLYSYEPVVTPIVDGMPAVGIKPQTRSTPIEKFFGSLKLVEIYIILLVAILLPQGLFTIYWQLYTWNHPDSNEKTRSPKKFATPQFSFTALLPARREEAVIKDTIYAIDAIDYPEHLKEILILIRDDDDDQTIAKAKEAIEEIGKDNIHLVTFKDGPKNKPNGLNRGLKIASKDVVCIFDAEDEPHREIYNVVNTVMLRDNADVVQSGVQLMNIETNWFSALNCLEYFFWFKSGLHAFTHGLNVTPLGGNTVFFKKHWLEKINGWDAGCLTEDADVGFRLTSLGAKIQIVYDHIHATQEETPDSVEQFIKQRTRWAQGFYEIFFKFEWLQLPTLKQKLTAIYILLNSLLQAALVLYLPIGLYVAFMQRVGVSLAMISYVPFCLLILQLLISVAGIKEFAELYDKKLPRYFIWRLIAAYYPYQIMLAVSAARAVYRLARRQSAWEKTAHSNLHRVASRA